MSTELATWRHPTTGMPITFQDLRPAALHDQPVKATGTLTATPIPVLPHTMVEVADHEGRHAAAASLFGFKMTEARADAPSDNLYGHVRLDLTDEHWTPLRLAQVMVIALVGDMGEENWPPSWPPNSNPDSASDDERQVAAITKALGLTAKQYNGLVDVARTINNHPAFKRLAGSYAWLMSTGMTLTAPMLGDLRAITDKRIEQDAEREQLDAEQQDHEPSPEHTRIREQHRDWMTAVLRDGAEYAEQQATKQKARRVEAKHGQPKLRLVKAA